MERVLDAVAQCAAAGGRAALCTIVETRGSVPAPAGARMLVRDDGSFVGTVGGGCLEHDVWAVARRVIDDGGARRVPLDLTDYEAQEAGLACGGSLWILVEPVTPALAEAVGAARQAAAAGEPAVLWHRLPPDDRPAPPAAGAVVGGACLGLPPDASLGPALLAAAAGAETRCAELAGPDGAARVFLQPLALPELVILGGGHVGRALDAAARPCGWRVTVVDDRADFANAERFPHARTIVAPFPEAFAGLHPGPSTAVLVVTRGHQYDAEALAAALQTAAGYVGLIGSARKILTVFARCLAVGISAERCAQVFAPIGVGIGAVTPAEIAAAVVAELVAVRRLGPERALALNPKAAAVRAAFLAQLAKRSAT